MKVPPPMKIEILCRTPEDLQKAITTWSIGLAKYVKVNKKDAELLSIVVMEESIVVSWADRRRQKRIVRMYSKEERLVEGVLRRPVQTLFNKRKTKVTFIVTGQFQETLFELEPVRSGQ